MIRVCLHDDAPGEWRCDRSVGSERPAEAREAKLSRCLTHTCRFTHASVAPIIIPLRVQNKKRYFTHQHLRSCRNSRENWIMQSSGDFLFPPSPPFSNSLPHSPSRIIAEPQRYTSDRDCHASLEICNIKYVCHSDLTTCIHDAQHRYYQYMYSYSYIYRS